MVLQNYRIIDLQYIKEVIKVRKHIEIIEDLYDIDISKLKPLGTTPLATGVTTLATSKVQLTEETLRSDNHVKGLPWRYNRLIDNPILPIADIKEALSEEEYHDLVAVGTINRLYVRDIIGVIVHWVLDTKWYGTRFSNSFHTTIVEATEIDMVLLETERYQIEFLQRLPEIIENSVRVTMKNERY